MAKFWAKRINYDITRLDEVPKAWREAVREIIEGMNQPTDFSSMTKAALLDYCAAHNIEARESWTKAEIIAAIEGTE